MYALRLAWILLLALPGCVEDPRPRADGAEDATPLDAGLPDAGIVDMAPERDATVVPDATPEPFAEPEPVPEPVAEPEPESIDEPARVRLIGFSADQRFLFIARLDAPGLSEQPPLESGQLERHTVATGEQVIIDTQVILSIANQRGVLFSADGETVVYAKRDADLPDEQWWQDRVAPIFHHWTPTQRGAHDRATRLFLDAAGRHMLLWPVAADRIDLIDLVDDRVSQLEVPRRFVHWGNAVVLGYRAQVEVLDLGTAQRRRLGEVGSLIDVDGSYALLDEADRLVAHDLATGDRFETPVEAPQDVAFFRLDRALGRGAVGVGRGAYGAIQTWALGSDVAETLEMPDPRAPGGSALASDVRLHATGLTYYPHATWVGRDMWDLRDGVATQVQLNNCSDRSLPGRALRLVIGSEAGCSTLAGQRMYLYDEPRLALRDTGKDVRGVWALLADGRVAYNQAEPREGMIWDIDADTVVPLGGRLGRVQTRRNATWMIGLLRVEGAPVDNTIVLVHPGGISTLAQAGTVAEMLVSEGHVAWVLRVEDADDVLQVEGFEALR